MLVVGCSDNKISLDFCLDFEDWGWRDVVV